MLSWQAHLPLVPLPFAILQIREFFRTGRVLVMARTLAWMLRSWPAGGINNIPTRALVGLGEAGATAGRSLCELNLLCHQRRLLYRRFDGGDEVIDHVAIRTSCNVSNGLSKHMSSTVMIQRADDRSIETNNTRHVLDKFISGITEVSTCARKNNCIEF